MSAFFCEKLFYFVQKSTKQLSHYYFTQSNIVRAVLEIFEFCFQFL